METATLAHTTRKLQEQSKVHKTLLVCGIIAPLLYIVIDIIAAVRLEGYNYAAQAISEMSAFGSPVRSFLFPFMIVYALLVVAFGFGVWKSPAGKRTLHISGLLLITTSIIGQGLGLFPMHQRGDLATGAGTFSDTMHLVFSGAVALSILFTILFGGLSFGRGFRIYSIITIIVLLFFGALTSIEATKLNEGLPTPLMGIYERINVFGFMIWMMVLAMVVLRAERSGTHQN